MKVLTIIFIVMGIITLGAIFTLLFWNWLMPDIFGLSKITIWQAWGLNCLAYIFFGQKTVNSSK